MFLINVLLENHHVLSRHGKYLISISKKRMKMVKHSLNISNIRNTSIILLNTAKFYSKIIMK